MRIHLLPACWIISNKGERTLFYCVLLSVGHETWDQYLLFNNIYQQNHKKKVDTITKLQNNLFWWKETVGKVFFWYWLVILLLLLSALCRIVTTAGIPFSPNNCIFMHNRIFGIVHIVFIWRHSHRLKTHRHPHSGS